MKTAFAIVLTLLAGCSSSPEAPGHAAAGARPPALVVAATDGRSVDLDAEMRAGRTVVLVFWQTWCGPCLAEAPHLAQAARDHADELAFVGVVPGPAGTVDEDELARVVKRLGLPYPQVRDTDLAWSRAFAIQGTPTIVALRADGSAGWTGHRAPADWRALLAAMKSP
jgi:cytochrome c biogenesis protein CcmG/thiol:disulfide interchange protein DsbE